MHTMFHRLPPIARFIHHLCRLTLVVLLLAGISTPVLAGESFTITVDLYAGFDISEQMTELEPTVITLIIGRGQEIDVISAPNIEPLFDFSDQTDLFFGLTTDAALPVSIVGDHLKGLIVLEDTPFDALTDEMLAQLDLPNAQRKVALDSNDLVVLVTDDDEYVLLGDVTTHDDATVTFTYRRTGAAVPEPGTLLLLGLGLGLTGFIKQRFMKQEGGNA